MHKKLVLLLVCCLLAGAVQAGPGRGKFKSKLKFVVKHQTVTHTLKKRAENSYQKASALLAARQNDFLFDEEMPAQNIRGVNRYPFLSKELYPEAPGLITSQQTRLYLQSKVNREIIKSFSLFDKWNEQVQTHWEDFARAQIKITHDPQEDAAWLAGQIGQNTSYLLLGEIHNTREIPLLVDRLIRQIRKHQPERKIFLFTEFMDHKSKNPTDTYLGNLFLDLKLDTDLNLQIVGLEPNFIDTKIVIEGKKHWNEFWISDEGVRLRNRYWLEVLNQYRAENPDALFIIYAGLFHTEYIYPNSLGRALPEAETFVVSFSRERRNPFDAVTVNKFLYERVLQFNDKELSRLAGFDVRIRVPNTKGIE